MKHTTKKDWYHTTSGSYTAELYVKPYRKIGNRKVRKYKDYIPDGNAYRKIYDLWWTIL